jgi:hypothetical protein
MHFSPIVDRLGLAHFLEKDARTALWAGQIYTKIKQGLKQKIAAACRNVAAAPSLLRGIGQNVISALLIS